MYVGGKTVVAKTSMKLQNNQVLEVGVRGNLGVSQHMYPTFFFPGGIYGISYSTQHEAGSFGKEFNFSFMTTNPSPLPAPHSKQQLSVTINRTLLTTMMHCRHKK